MKIPGGRKYSLALLGLMIASVGLFVGVVSDAMWVTAFGIVLGAYGVGNLVQKITLERKT